LEGFRMTEKVAESGLTWWSFLGIIYAAAVLTPASIWISLTGGGIGGYETYATIFFISELAFLMGKPLKRQEIFILLSVSGAAATSFWEGLIYRLYFRRSHIVASYIGAHNIPDWWAPPLNTGIWDCRTLFHPALLSPVLLIISTSIIGLIASLPLGLIASELYLKREKLPFPMQQVTAQICDSLAERGTQRHRVFMTFCLVGFLYAFFLYFIPSLSLALIGQPISVITLPWIDLTNYMDKILPGASFGISPLLTTFMVSFILPTNVILSQVISSLVIYMVCNPLFVSYNVYTEWVPGLSLETIWTRTTLYFWAPVSIGLSVGAGTLPFIFRLLRRRAFSGISKSSKVKSSFSFKNERKIWGSRTILLLLIFLLCAAISVMIDISLAPEFPFIIFLFFNIMWPLIMVLFNVRAIGVTGYGVSVPNIREGVIYLTGYGKYDIWFTPTPTMGSWLGASSWVTSFKVCELTSTSWRSLILANITATLISWITGFVFMNIMWSMAPIPSSIFPVPTWDRTVVIQTQFISGQLKRYDPVWIVGGFLTALILQCLQAFTPVKVSPIGFAAGVATPVPVAFTMFLGLIVKGFINKIEGGRGLFSRYRTVILAGTVTGQGVIASLGVALAIIAKGIWPSPY